jgi:hypothetical protein
MLEYSLEKQTSPKPYFRVTIIADANDGDYVTYVTEEYEEYSDDLLNAISMFLKLDFDKYDFHNLENAFEDLYKNSPDDYYFINEYLDIPRNSFYEIAHSLENFYVEYIDTEGQIYNVIFKGYEKWCN